MNLFRRTLKLIGVLVLAGASYVFYGFVSAEGRLKEVCSQIKPGMSVADLRNFGKKHGLGPGAPGESGVHFMVETRTFGRYGCTVILEAGIVKDAKYNFAD
jgi:hypothetical protein